MAGPAHWVRCRRGVLRAGKSTPLNRLLRDLGAGRLVIMRNAFGALNIDAQLIASIAGKTVPLPNGCVCCSIGHDLSAARKVAI